MEFMPELLKRLKIELERSDHNGIYGLMQRLLAFHSNRMAGGRLTLEQTAFLFETGAIGADGEMIVAKDIEEMHGHFLMDMRMMGTWEEPLSHSLIQQYHADLRSGVFEDRWNGAAIGEYRREEDVLSKMEQLLQDYESKPIHSLEELARFHAAYEAIHPFQDGNGRTGRILLFKECLRNGLMPFIIEDKDKAEYYDALAITQQADDASMLVELFQKSQHDFHALAEGFVIPTS